MKSKKIYVSLAVLTLILTAGVASVSAYQGDYSKTGPNCTPERHEAMEAAFNNNDYNAWAEQMTGKGRVTQVINESNFSQFAEAHRLGQAGDTAGADALREKLGLRTSNGERMGAGYKGGNGGQNGQGRKQGQGQGGSRNFVDNNGDGVCDGDCNNLNQ
jgi:hypothetical protein